MLICDLCNLQKDCLQKDIEGKEYDICRDCWNSLAEKLKGKGRVKKDKETVLLPSVEPEKPQTRTTPHPGGPPKIFGTQGGRVN